MRLLQLNVFGFLLVLSATATSFAADKWLSIQTNNFLLVGNASESSIRRVGRELEEFRAGLGLIFKGIDRPSAVGTTVIVFKDDASFRPYKPLYQGKPGNVAGYFQAGEDMNFIALASDSRSPNVIYHEFVHALTRDATLPLPLWASEGYAEVLGMFELSGKDMLVGRAIGEHVIALNRERMLPLETLFSIDHGSPHYNESTKQGIFYAQSWATVHYLMFGNNGKRRPQLATYLTLTSNGKTIAENFREAFQTDFATLQEEIRKYVQQQVLWPAIKLKLPDGLNVDRQMQASHLSEAQSQYYLGDLLLHMRRMDVAEAHLQKAVSLDPNFAASYASLGLLRLREGKNQEALQFLTRAVEGDSSNHLAHFHYVHLLQKLEEGDSVEARKVRWDTMRTHIQKTIELAPQFIEAYGMLGYIALVSKEGIVDAENAIKKAVGIAPGRMELRLRLAELMFANKEVASAQAILTSLKNNSTEDRIRSQAERLLDHIEKQQDYEREMRAYEQRRREFAEAAARVSVAEDRPVEAVDDGPPRLTRSDVVPPGSADAKDAQERVNRQPETPEEFRVEGFLTQMDCSNGLTLRIRTGSITVQLHTNQPSAVEFVSYVSAVTNAVTCGVMKPEMPVAVTFRRGTDRRYLGEPLRVDFVKPN